MASRRRDFERDNVLRFHLTDGTSAEGVYTKRSRNYYHLEAASLEANGKLVKVTGERTLINRSLVKAVQVIG